MGIVKTYITDPIDAAKSLSLIKIWDVFRDYRKLHMTSDRHANDTYSVIIGWCHMALKQVEYY